MKNRIRALVVVNRLARQGSADLQEAMSALADAGMDLKIHQVEDAALIRQIIQSSRNDDLFIIGGGDGTLNASVEAVLEKKRPLGILPIGTANDLARSLGIPASPAAAADIIARGSTRRIDLGWVNGKHYFNVASIGLSTQLSRQLTRELKKRYGALAYPISFLSAYKATRPFHARIHFRGGRKNLKSIQIAVGNGRHYGGGLTVRQDARIDDHLLNLYSLEAQSLIQLFATLPHIARGTNAPRERAWYADGREFHIFTRKPMRINTDGELTTWTPALFRVRPSILPVVVP